MTSTFPVPLAPNNLARHPVFWSSAEVKAWVEFCVQEFSLSPIAFDRFDMNGKALMLLNRSDFMERAPRVGDVLYNAFTHLSMASVSGSNYTFNTSIKTPVFISRDLGSQREYLYSSAAAIPNSSHPPSSPFIPILPHPATPTKRHHHSVDGGVGPAGSEGCLRSEATGLETVPGSILSPAVTDKSFSDTESCHNYTDSPIKLRDSPSVDRHTDTTTSTFPEEGEGHHDGMDIASSASEHKGDCRLLWEFIYQLLCQDQGEDLVCWENESALVFRINDPNGLADQWGSQKNRTNMTYEKLSRALRYYYKMNIIQKVPGKKLTYKFLQSPEKIRRGQRGAKPHSFRSPQRSSFSSSSDSSSMTNNNDGVSMETKEEAFSMNTTLALVADRKSSLGNSSKAFSPSTSKNVPIKKMVEEKKEEKDKTYSQSEELDTQLTCPSKKPSLENQQTNITDTGDVKVMIYDNYKQPTFEDDEDRLHGMEMKLSSLSPPISRALPQDQIQSELACLLRSSEDDSEMNNSTEEPDSSEEFRPSDVNENCNSKEAIQPGSTCFENESTLKESQEVDVKENFNRNPSNSSLVTSDLFNDCGKEIKSEGNSSILQSSLRCSGTPSVPSYLLEENISASFNQDSANSLQLHSCITHPVQLKCSKALFISPESQSPTLELLQSSSRCNDQLSASPSFKRLSFSLDR